MALSSEWEFAGIVGVDSGQILITDPCYLESEWDPVSTLDFGEANRGVYSYDGACNATIGDPRYGQLNYRMGHAGAGVALASGYGDGSYEVFVRKNEDGRIAEARIIMIEEDEDEDAV